MADNQTENDRQNSSRPPEKNGGSDDKDVILVFVWIFIWFAFIFTIVMFVIICWVANSPPARLAPDNSTTTVGEYVRERERKANEILREREARKQAILQIKIKKAEELAQQIKDQADRVAAEKRRAEEAEKARVKRVAEEKERAEEIARAKASAARQAEKKKANATDADGLPKEPIASFKFFAGEQIDLLKKMQTTGDKTGLNIGQIDGNYGYDIKKTDSIVSPLIGHLTIKIEFKPRYEFTEYWVTAEIDGMSPWWTEHKEWGQLRGHLVIKECLAVAGGDDARINAKRMVGLKIPFDDITNQQGLKARLMFEVLR